MRTVALALSAAVVCGCDVFPCGDTLLARYPSPDGKVEAVVWQRDCGATTSYSVIVEIDRVRRRPELKIGRDVIVLGAVGTSLGGRVVWTSDRSAEVRTVLPLREPTPRATDVRIKGRDISVRIVQT